MRNTNFEIVVTCRVQESENNLLWEGYSRSINNICNVLFFKLSNGYIVFISLFFVPFKYVYIQMHKTLSFVCIS